MFAVDQLNVSVAFDPFLQVVGRPLRSAVAALKGDAAPASAMTASRRLILAAPLMTSAFSLAGQAGADAGMKTSESGIQYVELQEGTGPSPAKGARIK